MTLLGALIAHKGHRLESRVDYKVPDGKVFGTPHVTLWCWTCEETIHDEALETLRPKRGT